MSTRAQVAFVSPNYIEDKKGKSNKKYEVLLYFHRDGYPSGILPHLIPFLFEFKKKRGLDDISYAAAWLMHHMIKERGYNYSTLKEAAFLSHGIDNDIHEDIDYLYEIYPDKLLVIVVNKVFKNNTVKGTLLKEIPLDKDIDEFTTNMIIESIKD